MKLNLEEVKKLIEEKYSIVKLEKHFNVSNSTIRYFLKKNNLKTKGYVNNINWTKEIILKALCEANSKSDVLRNMGISTKSGNFQTLDRYCSLYNIVLPLFIKNANNKNNNNCFKRQVTNKELFCDNSKHAASTAKKRIEKDKLIEYKCKKCGNLGEWMEEKISLQLDHENGKNNDHRLENLRYLCPNCHSQTKTYSGKKLKIKTLCICGKEKNKNSEICFSCYSEKKSKNSKINISKEELEKLIKEKSYVEIGKMFDVGDNTVKKRALKLGIKLENRKKRNQFYYK